MGKSKQLQEAWMMDSFNCSRDTIYSKANFDKLFLRWLDLSSALQSITEEIGDSCGEWKLRRMSAKRIVKMNVEINDALKSYVAREEFLDNNPDETPCESELTVFDLVGYLLNPQSEGF